MKDAAPCEWWWTVTRGPGPVLATAIHDGHDLRPAVAEVMTLPDVDRLREEDPFTAQAVTGVPTHIVVHRSRFEFDLNRAPDTAVYRTPEQSWGLQVWRSEPDQALVADIQDRVIKIFEACNFQDLTGQRITKVVSTLQFIETHIVRMMEIWGGLEAFKDIEAEQTSKREDDAGLLNGPKLAGETGHASQDDIDALFA